MDSLYRYVRNQVFGERGDPVVVQRVPVHGACQPHEHDFIEIVLVTGGEGIQETARRNLPIRSGILTVLRPGHWHAYQQCRRLQLYNCCFGPELLRHELSWLIDDPTLGLLLWGAGDMGNETRPPIFNLSSAAVKRLRRILDEASERSKASYGWKVSQLSLFLTSLTEELPLPEDKARSRMQQSIQRSIRLLEGDLARVWTIRDLAQECGCSSEYLIRQFKSAIGMTPYAYLSRCRAERAAGLLMRSSASVAEIGEAVGWAEPCHFARSFRKHYGTTATDYRSRMRNSRSSSGLSPTNQQSREPIGPVYET